MLAVLVAIWGMSAGASAAPPQSADFIVSKAGRDDWSGKLPRPNRRGTDGPFATLERAREAVRGLSREGREGPVTVRVRGGTYELSKTFVLSPEDSGTAASPVIYAAWPGEKPVVSGGRKIGRWRRMAGKWEAKVPGVAEGKWVFRQLFVDGERRFRPRLPREGYFHIARGLSPSPRNASRGWDRFGYAADDIPAELARPDEVEVLLFHNWFMSRMLIEEIDRKKRIVTLTGPTVYRTYWADLSRGRRYILENVREALTEPGQWHLNQGSGVLTYLPRRGEKPGRTQVVAPLLKELVVFEGDPASLKWVEHVIFEGISFRHTAYDLPDAGYSCAQAESQLGAAIRGTGARHCALVNCEVANTGQYAISWRAGCRHNRVEGCALHDLGAGGIKIGEMRLPGPAAATELIAGHQVVRDCTIAHAGRVHPAGVGIWIGHSPHNVIEHNDIYDLYYTGISVGWCWGYKKSGAHHNALTANHIHTIGQGVLTDMGGIYTLGRSPGTILADNLMHDIESYDYGGWGIYFDEGTTGAVAERNLVYKTKSGGFHQHYGRDNVVRNNILAFGREGQLIRTRAEDHKSYTLERNVVVSSGAPFLGGDWTGEGFEIDGNIYWDFSVIPRGPHSGVTWDDWRKSGHDADSLIVDPKFRDPEKGDFRLRRNSPVAQVGFVPFDYGKAGRRSAPPRLPPAPRAYPAGDKAQAAALPIWEDFEGTRAGELAPDAITHEDGETPSLRVSAEDSFRGRRSLKFTKPASVEKIYNPHIYYDTDFRSGVLTASFHLRKEPTGAFIHEWRDVFPGEDPWYRSGPLLVVEASGLLKASDRDIHALPLGEWVKIRVSCEIGEDASGTYDLELTLPGGEVKNFAGLPCKGKLERLRWLGFSAYGPDSGAVGFLDDVSLTVSGSAPPR